MLVSVSMVTYNHAGHIGKAIESVLAQERPGFELELVIGEDCSTDGTADIVASYAERHPDVITVVTDSSNVGAQRNVRRVLERCAGDYIALLDGDDCWTSTRKLQRQVEFMEGNAGCALCFHNVQVIDENGEVEGVPDMSLMPERSSLDDLLIGNYISSCSVMYRAGLVNQLPSWWDDVEMADFPLHIMHAQFGWVGYIDEVLAAYRRHPGGIFSVKRPVHQIRAFMKVLRKLDGYLPRRHHRQIRRSLARLRLSLVAAGMYAVAPWLRPAIGWARAVVRRVGNPVA